MEIGNPVTFAGCSARCSYGSPKTSQFMNSFGLELPGFPFLSPRSLLFMISAGSLCPGFMCSIINLMSESLKLSEGRLLMGSYLDCTQNPPKNMMGSNVSSPASNAAHSIGLEVEREMALMSSEQLPIGADLSCTRIWPN